MRNFFKRDRAKEIDSFSSNVVRNLSLGDYSDIEIAQIVNDIKSKTISLFGIKNEQLTNEKQTLTVAIHNLTNENS